MNNTMDTYQSFQSLGINPPSEAPLQNFAAMRFEEYWGELWALCQSLFPGRTQEAFRIDDLTNGAFNRVVVISVRDLESPYLCGPWKSYVVRIPMNDIVNIALCMSTLQFVHERMPVPVPRVLHFSTAGNNPLGRPYLLQPHFRGESLETFWDFNKEQQESATQGVTEVLMNMYNITSKTAGMIAPLPGTDGVSSGVPPLSHGCYQVVPLEPFEDKVSKPQTTLQLMLAICKKWKELQPAEDPDWVKPGWHGLYRTIWDQCMDVTSELHKLGYMPDSDPFHLCHGDLHPGNVLAEVIDEEQVRITAVIDWDNAQFVPSFIAIRDGPRSWLVCGDDDDERSQSEAEMCDRVYRTTLSPALLRFATKPGNTPELRIAQRLWDILHVGVKNQHQLAFAGKVVKDFRKLRPLKEHKPEYEGTLDGIPDYEGVPMELIQSFNLN